MGSVKVQLASLGFEEAHLAMRRVSLPFELFLEFTMMLGVGLFACQEQVNAIEEVIIKEVLSVGLTYQSSLSSEVTIIIEFVVEVLKVSIGQVLIRLQVLESQEEPAVEY